MMVSLVTPNEKTFLNGAGDRAPLGVLYLSAALTANKIPNKVTDLNHTSWVDFINQTKKEKPDMLGLSIISSPAYPQMKALAQKLKPYVGKIVAGGFHASALPETLDGIADAVVIGDGEQGIITALNKDGIINKPVGLNTYPIPDRTALPSERYNMNLLGLRITGMTTARGCPFSCAFCGNMNKTVKFRDPKNIREEVKLIKTQGYEAVYFYNESHTVNKHHATEVGEMMKENGMRYRMETRANLIDDDTARMLSDTGCMMVALGIESGDDKVLEAINKGETTDDYRKTVKLLSRHGIPTKGYFIMGLPEQDLASGLKTIEFAKEMQREGMIGAGFYSLTPFPGSPIAADPEKYGITVLHNNYKKYLEVDRDTVNPVIETRWLSKEGIKSLVDRANLEWNRN